MISCPPNLSTRGPSYGEKNHQRKGKGSPNKGGMVILMKITENGSASAYSLKDLFPRIASERHPTRNGTLTSSDVTPGSGRKVWWRCDNGHEWVAVISSRARGGVAHTALESR